MNTAQPMASMPAPQTAATVPAPLARSPRAATAHRCALALSSLVLVAACSTPPAPRFHSLRSAQPAPNVAHTPLWVDLAPVGVPAAVDQPQWVVRVGDDSLRILEQERWVAPLRDELRAALADHLRQGFGVMDARHAPPAAASTSAVRLRLQVDVQRFELLVGQGAWLESAWSVTAAGVSSPGVSCTSALREAAPGDLSSLAAAQRRAVQALADQMGRALRALAAGQPVACEG